MNVLRRCGFILGFLVAAGACASPARRTDRELSMSTDTRTISEKLRAGVDRRLELGLGFGFVAAILDGGKSQTFTRGLKSVEPPAPLSETSVLEIGSVSKLFTGILVHHAVLEGKLKLSTTLAEILPSLRDRPAGGITIEALGIHCSGLPRVIPSMATSDPLDPYRDGTEKILLDALADAKDVMPSGCDYKTSNYSNFGYATLGLALEKVYRRSFRQILKAKLVGPLHLGGTDVDRTFRSGRKPRPKAVFGYTPAGNLTPAWTFPGAYAAAGGIEMTVEEMAHFLEALASPPTSTAGRAIRASIVSGIGWDSEPGVGLLWKNGMTGGFGSMLIVDPKTKRAVFTATNIHIGPDSLAAFAMGAYPKDTLVEQVEMGRIHAPDEEVARLKGKYAFSRVLDSDRDPIDPAKLPPNELEPAPTSVEAFEKSGRLGARVIQSGVITDAFLYPEAKENRWHVVDGVYDTDFLEISGEGKDARLFLPATGTSGKKYWFEMRKLEAKSEIYPAFER